MRGFCRKCDAFVLWCQHTTLETTVETNAKPLAEAFIDWIISLDDRDSGETLRGISLTTIIDEAKRIRGQR